MSNEIYIGKDGQQYRFDSDKNKKIIKKMASREILANVTTIILGILNLQMSGTLLPRR